MGNSSEDQFFGRVSRRLVEERRKRGFSQERLAVESGLSAAHIGHIEQGHRRPTLVTLYRLAKGLKVEPSELLK